jgi:hypothetical protein
VPPRTVREDWVAWLPPDKEDVFRLVVEDLESLYSMLSISLNEAFTLRRESTLEHARTQVGVTADLLDRLAVRLTGVLQTLHDHSRHFGTLPNITPLNPGFFRGETGQRYARRSVLLGKVLFPTRSRYFHKLRLLVEAVGSIQTEYREISDEVAGGCSVQPGFHWGELEVLHYDLNTCLREGMVMLKSFLCALPNGELKAFRRKLEGASLVPAGATACSTPDRPRRAPLL